MLRFLLGLCCVLVLNLSWAQDNASDPKWPVSRRSDRCESMRDGLNDFLKTQKKGVTKAKNHVSLALKYIRFADYLRHFCFDGSDHFEVVRQALPHLNKVQTKDSSATAQRFVHFLRGVAYAEAMVPDSAAFYLKRVQQMGGYEHLSYFYYLGTVLQANQEYPPAMAAMGKAKSMTLAYDALFSDLALRIKQCENALSAETREADVKNLGANLNGQHQEYAPLANPTDSVLRFTLRGMDPVCRFSPKKQARILKQRRRFSSFYLEQIYESVNENGSWSCARRLPSPINHRSYDNATAGLSPDGETLYIYRRKSYKMRSGKDRGNLMTTGIETVRTKPEKNDRWSKPVGLNGANSTEAEEHISVSPDGTWAIFSSDRKGGQGGYDLWMADVDENGQLSDPRNLGPGINTKGDERGPHMYSDGQTLYFSSNAHTSMGGYDVFVTKRKGAGWAKPQNMGTPINSPGHDLYFQRLPNSTKAYYSSSRSGGMGGMDLYQVSGPELGYQTVKIDPVLALLVGYEGLDQAGISRAYFGLGTGYFPGDDPYGGLTEVELELELLESIGRVNFAFAQADLTEFSRKKLDVKLIPLMQKLPRHYIVLVGHTDPFGDSKYNLDLSKRRVKAVFDYLVKQGVSADRIKFNYHGEKYLLFQDGSKDEHIVNRRVEVYIRKALESPNEGSLRNAEELN